MSGPLSAPWTEIGRLQSEISSLRSELSRKANSYEIISLNGKIISMEHTLRELRTEIVGIRSKLQELQTN